MSSDFPYGKQWYSAKGVEFRQLSKGTGKTRLTSNIVTVPFTDEDEMRWTAYFELDKWESRDSDVNSVDDLDSVMLEHVERRLCEPVIQPALKEQPGWWD
jgi:hypothetical protein